MRKEKFVKGYLEKLIEDPEIKSKYSSLESEIEKEYFVKKLEETIGNSYEEYAKDYFESKGVGSYISTLLRVGGGLADSLGTYLFWAFGGAGFGLKGVGLIEKSIADIIDSRYYIKHAKTSKGEKTKDLTETSLEGAAERALAYLPLGIGEITDFLRGRSKYDNKIIKETLYHAKKNFLEYLEKVEKPKIVKLDNFRVKQAA